MTEIVRHLGGPENHALWAEWLGLNFARFSQALNSVVFARREQMFAGLDVECVKAVYELRQPFARCRNILDDIPAVVEEDLADGERDEGFAEARVWFDDASETLIKDALPILGRVLLGQTYWRLEAIGLQKYHRLRELFENALREEVLFSGERREDILSQMRAKEPAYDRGLVPPRLLEGPSKLSIASHRVPASGNSGSPFEMESKWTKDQAQAWLDQSVPMFDGKTPREASRDPLLRQKLVRLLKDRIRAADQKNLEEGRSDDLNWLAVELGLNEIVFDPPPVRAPIIPWEAIGTDLPELKPWPKPPPGPFTPSECMDRLEAGPRRFPDLVAAINAMNDAGGFLNEDVLEVTGSYFTDEELDILEAQLTRVWFAFVPPGYFGPDIELEEIEWAFREQLASLTSAGKNKKPFTHAMLDASAQPNLLAATIASLIDMRDESNQPPAFSDEKTALAGIVLKVIIDLLDSKCREGT
jgi:hypothetical protein